MTNKTQKLMGLNTILLQEFLVIDQINQEEEIT